MRLQLLLYLTLAAWSTSLAQSPTQLRAQGKALKARGDASGALADSVLSTDALFLLKSIRSLHDVQQ